MNCYLIVSDSDGDRQTLAVGEEKDQNFLLGSRSLYSPNGEQSQDGFVGIFRPVGLRRQRRDACRTPKCHGEKSSADHQLSREHRLMVKNVSNQRFGGARCPAKLTKSIPKRISRKQVSWVWNTLAFRLEMIINDYIRALLGSDSSEQGAGARSAVGPSTSFLR